MKLNNSRWALGAFFLIVTLLYMLYPSPGVPILAYHQVNDEPETYSVSPAEFTEQMRYLAERGYTAVSLTEVFDAWEGKGELPEKPIVITFDDGYIDNYVTALPIMERFGLKATIFVISGNVGQADYLTWQQIRELRKHGTEIGSHTADHVALGQTSPNEQLRQVALSRQVLESNLGVPITFLAYPFGSFDEATVNTLRQSGYRGACTGLVGVNSAGADPYRLKRINVPRPKFGIWEFRIRLLRAELYGTWELLTGRR